MSKREAMRRALWGGVFLIGLGIILLTNLNWATVLILIGALLIADGVIKYYLPEGEREEIEKEK